MTLRRAVRVLTLGAATAAISPGAASAAVSVTSFSVTPSTTQAGGHSNLVVDTSLASNPDTDDVKSLNVVLPQGLVGDPRSAGRCSQSSFAGDACPADSKVGITTVTCSSPSGRFSAMCAMLTGKCATRCPSASRTSSVCWLRLMCTKAALPSGVARSTDGTVRTGAYPTLPVLKQF